MDNHIEIRVLLDNEAEKTELKTEHGISVHINVYGKKILFDTGQTGGFAANAERLGVDLSKVDYLVISHGHYDHAGGIPEFLDLNSKALIYIHKEAFKERYSIRENSCRYIGIRDNLKKRLKTHEAERLRLIKGETMLTPETGITGGIPRNNGFEDAGGPFFLDTEGREPDSIPDDMSMWITWGKEIIVICGCCHSGIVNTLNRIKKITDASQIKGIIGGLHLINADENRLENTVKNLKTLSPDFIAPCHCTGKNAENLLKAEFPGAYRGCSGGTYFVF